MDVSKLRALVERWIRVSRWDPSIAADGYAACADELQSILDSPEPEAAQVDADLDAHTSAVPIEEECRIQAALEPLPSSVATLNRAADELESLRAQVAQLEQDAINYRATMAVASDEIWSRWEHHCDEEGYGPSNLMRRLDAGIPAEYNPHKSDYATVADLRAQVAELTARLAEREADAERYRWLRDRGFSFSHDEAHRGISASRWGDWAYDTDQGAASERDAAIDAARSPK